MAQYDGSIRIKTEIESKQAKVQLSALENRMVKTADKIASLRSKMDSLKDVKIPTQEYKDLQKELELLSAKTKDIENVPTKGYEKLQDSIKNSKLRLEEFENEQKKLFESGIGKDYDKDLSYLAAYENVKKFKSELQKAIDIGDQDAYMGIEDSLNRAKSVLESMMSKEQRPLGDISYYFQIEKKISDLKGEISGTESEMKKLEESGKAFSINENTQKIENLKAKMKELEQSGKAFTLGSDTEEYTKLGQQLKYAESSAEILSQKHDILEKKIKLNSSGYKKLSAVAKSALSKMSGMMGNIASSTKKAVASIGKMAASFLHIGKNAKSASGGLKTMLKNALGISSLYMLFSKLRAAIQEGFGNLTQFSKPVNSAISSLMSSLAQLKNSFATAFAPILTAVAPALNTLINLVSKAVTAIGMLIAALTGQGTFTKAAKVQQDYAKSLGGTAKAAKNANKQLSNLDKLNNLTSQDKSGSGGGAGGIGIGDMFEKVEIPSKIQKLADMIKKAWENADFTEIGKMIGKKLKKALDSIPWDEIQSSARKIGSSLATLINGFVEVKGLGNSIGKTLSKAFNTAFYFLNRFVHKLRWKSVGKFVADTLNGVFENINWELIRDTFVTGFKGLADSINSFIDNFHWDNLSNTISNAINTVTETVYTFFSTVRFDDLGQKLGEQLKKSIEKIDWEMVGRAIGSVIQSALDFVISFVGELDLGDVAQAVIDVLKGFFETVDMGDIAKVIMTLLAVKLSVSATASVFKSAAGNILKSISASIATAQAGGGLASVGSNILSGISASVDTLVSTGSFATVGGNIAGGIFGGIIAAIAGWNIGQAIDEAINGKDWANQMSFGEQMKEIFGSFRDGSWKDAFKLWGQDISLGIKEGIEESSTGFGGWVQDYMYNPLVGSFKLLFGIHSPSTVMAENGKYIIQGLLEGLKNNISSVLDWLNNIPTWFKKNFDQAYKFATNAFSNVGKFFSGVWKNIQDVFGNISGWFKDKFTVAWTAVKNVFSKGGKIFDGIKDGILNGLKIVINGIIGGINKVIAVPFNGLNKALGKLKAINIGGTKPFGFLPNIKVPQITPLATGTVVPPNREFLALLGDNKKEPEVVSPISTMKQAVLEAISESGITSGGGNDYGDIVVMIDGREVFRAVRKQSVEYKKQTGKPAFS